MKESLSTYAKLIPFAIKNKRVLEFINLKWQKDSDKWKRKRQAEYKITWPHLKKGGFLISDYVSQNNAFLNFADLIQKKPIIITKNSGSHFGLIRK